MTDLEAKLGIAGLGVVAALVAALIKLRHRNGRAKPVVGWTKELATFIDERATHKAANAAAPVLMEVSNVRKDLVELKAETAKSVEKIERQIDAVQDNVSGVREGVAALRGELGYDRRQREGKP